MNEQKTLSVRETASLLQCTLKYAYDLIYMNRLTATKSGNSWRVSVDSVQAHLESRSRSTLKVEQKQTESEPD